MLINYLINQKNVIFFICFFDKKLNYEPYLCNDCHDMIMKAVSFNDVAVVSVKENAYRIHFCFKNKTMQLIC